MQQYMTYCKNQPYTVAYVIRTNVHCMPLQSAGNVQIVDLKFFLPPATRRNLDGRNLFS